MSANITRVFTLMWKASNKFKSVPCNYILSKNNRSFHACPVLCVKLYKERENVHAYGIMEHGGYAVKLDLDVRTPSESYIENNIIKMNEVNWSKEAPSKLLEVFRDIAFYCCKHNICISHTMFDSFIDNFTDSIQHLTDDELRDVFYLMNVVPSAESIRTRNFIEVWAALDDACLQRMRTDWRFDKMLEFVSLMYMLNLTRVSEFTYKCLQKMTNKAKHLTSSQLVQVLFYIGIVRRATIGFHFLEVELENRLSDFSVNELSIMSMGFFKSQTPIRSMSLVTAIVHRVIENKKDLHEISLAALLKVIRYSMKVATNDCIYKLLDALISEVPRLSTMCCVHIALLGTATLTFHEQCLHTVAQAVHNNISIARVKDLERLVFSFGTFNLIPKTKTPFYDTILDELRKPERDAEIKKYARSFANCITYMNFVNIHPQDLIDKILDEELLKDTYGNAVYTYGREILTLHNISCIYFKDINMNRLSDKTVRILAKKFTDYMPDENYKQHFNIVEKMILDILKTLQKSRGDEYVKGYHILPHYQRGDIILCEDENRVPIKIPDFGSNQKFGPITFPLDNNIWIPLVVVGRNGIIGNTGGCTGPFVAKVQELRAMGYHPALVNWRIWSKLITYEERLEYLNNLINEAIKYRI